MEHRSPSFFQIFNKNKRGDFICYQTRVDLIQKPLAFEAIQYGKEPFSDPIGPMVIEDPQLASSFTRDILLPNGNPSSVEMTHSVTKNMVSSVVGLAADKSLIRSLNDNVYTYLPPIEIANSESISANQNPMKSSFIYPF
jgi:hypothetical protein